MKKKITENFKALIKSLYLPVTAAIILMSSFSLNAKANDSTGTTNIGAEIKYLGVAENEQAVFQVEFDNENHQAFSLMIKDENGVILYSQNFRDVKFSKKFYFNKDEFRDSKLTFSLKSKEGNEEQTFRLNTKTVENTVVTKL